MFPTDTRVRNKSIMSTYAQFIMHNFAILLPDDYVTIKYKSRRGEYATIAHDCCGGRIATFATNITLSVGAMRNAVALAATSCN